VGVGEAGGTGGTEGEADAFGGREGLVHRFAAAWVRVRAFGDGYKLCAPRDDPQESSAVCSARFSIYLSIYLSPGQLRKGPGCPSGASSRSGSTSLPRRFRRFPRRQWAAFRRRESPTDRAVAGSRLGGPIAEPTNQPNKQGVPLGVCPVCGPRGPPDDWDFRVEDISWDPYS